VVHSVTKYIGGHSDVLGGAIVARRAESPLFERVRAIQKGAGAVMDPFSAWLALRGMRSLAARLYRQCDSAERIAAFLDSHGRIARVHFPGLPAHPGHAAAARQMSRFGAMISIEHAGGEEGALAMAAQLQLFRRATSLGGTESLVEHRASIEPDPSPTPRSLLRLSIGLEDADDLLQDLDRALGAS
jgi:cystathionine gamma-synthase